MGGRLADDHDPGPAQAGHRLGVVVGPVGIGERAGRVVSPATSMTSLTVMGMPWRRRGRAGPTLGVERVGGLQCRLQVVVGHPHQLGVELVDGGERPLDELTLVTVPAANASAAYCTGPSGVGPGRVGSAGVGAVERGTTRSKAGC